MVAITSGGLVPAAIVRADSACGSSRQSGPQSHAREKIQGRSSCVEGLLVIDDLAGTGAKVKIVRATLPKAHVATVYAKPLARVPRGPSPLPSLPGFRRTPDLFPLGPGLEFSGAGRRV
ncbi:MAG: hypothetical protein WBW81_05680 [Methylocella sp.]